MSVRAPALAPLSRDHHHALVIAMALSRAGDATAEASAQLFADFISDHERRHFALEESVLLPALPAGERARWLVERVHADHTYLRDAAERIRLGHLLPTIEALRAIGARLREHVQLEERELFPYLEQSLDPGALEAIAARIAAAQETT